MAPSMVIQRRCQQISSWRRAAAPSSSPRRPPFVECPRHWFSAPIATDPPRGGEPPPLRPLPAVSPSPPTQRGSLWLPPLYRHWRQPCQRQCGSENKVAGLTGTKDPDRPPSLSAPKEARPRKSTPVAASLISAPLILIAVAAA